MLRKQTRPHGPVISFHMAEKMQPPCLEPKLLGTNVSHTISPAFTNRSANNSSTLKDPKRDALDLGLGLDDMILQGLRSEVFEAQHQSRENSVERC